MRTLIALVVAVLAAASLSHADPTYAVCDTVKGFAGEMNYQFSLVIATPPREGEAIVLVARSVPYLDASALPIPQLSATYKLLGVDTPVTADRFGVLQIADAVEADSLVNITISNIRPDGPTPFMFYSFHTGYRSCSLNLSPTASYSGPVPLHVSNSNNPALVYLKATPPPTARNFALQVRGNALVAYSAKEHETGFIWTSERAAAPVPIAGQPVYFTLRLREGATAAEFVRVSLQWLSATGDQAPATPPQSPDAPPPPVVVAPPPTSDGWTAPTPNAPASPSSNSKRTAVEEGTSIPVVLFVLVLTYFIVRSVYNYRVQSITEFPKFVPHHEVFSSIGSFFSSLASHVRNRGRGGFLNRGAGAYSDVDREEMPSY